MPSEIKEDSGWGLGVGGWIISRMALACGFCRPGPKKPQASAMRLMVARLMVARIIVAQRNVVRRMVS